MQCFKCGYRFLYKQIIDIKNQNPLLRCRLQIHAHTKLDIIFFAQQNLICIGRDILQY